MLSKLGAYGMRGGEVVDIQRKLGDVWLGVMIVTIGRGPFSSSGRGPFVVGFNDDGDCVTSMYVGKIVRKLDDPYEKLTWEDD